MRGLVLVVLGAGCVGTIREPSRGASGPTEKEMQGANPQLYSIATKYFPGQATVDAPKRLSRLTRTQLDLTTKTLLLAHVPPAALDILPPDPLQTNYEYAANLSFNAANFTPYTKWVDELVAGVRARPASVIDCPAGGDLACLQAQAKAFVATAFRGTASEAQLRRFSDLFTASLTEVGLSDATADLVGVTLTSPGYVFRDEVLTDGSGLLLPAQRLQNLTYTLADAPPEALGLSSVQPNTHVATADDVQRTIDGILATPEARAKLARFLAAWLEIKELDEFTIAPSVFPEFTPAVAATVVEETKAFLSHHLSKAAPLLKDITQSTSSAVGDALASIYGADLDPAKRMGIFTQPAVIASHSGPTTTRLVKRGVFFTRKVMCLPLGLPPAGADTTLPSTAGATERQKIESVTNAPKCAACHAIINPFGFMQENYDAIGRWRMTDEGLPIDASISVDFLDEGHLSADAPVSALRGLTSSLLFKQCFVRQLFRFYTGRDEAPGDDPLLRRMFFGFADGDGQAMVNLLRVLGSSSSFSQRREAP
jgi:hypothetical protein